MQVVHLEAQPESVTVDEATKAVLEQSRASAARGETVTLEQSTLNMKKRLEAWRRAKAETKLAA